MAVIEAYALEYSDGTLYVGMTGDLPRRLEEHRRRQSPSTKRFKGAFRVVYQKSFPDHQSARSHEKYLKSGAGRTLIRQGIRT